MSGAPKNRPSKAWLQKQIEAGKTRTEIANACGAVNDTVSKWCAHYDIRGVGRWNKPKDIECGLATVVAMITADDEPERYAIPGGGIVDRDEARLVVTQMDDVMAGRVSG